MNKSLIMIEHLTQLDEQQWYTVIVPLAKKLQTYLLGKGGIFFISKRDFLKDFPSEPPEDLNMAIQILLSNAALFPAGGDTYRINWSRMSSALL